MMRRAAVLLGNCDLSVIKGIEFHVSCLATRVQLPSDGHRAYLEAVEGAFGCSVDYTHWSRCMAMLVRLISAATVPRVHWHHKAAVEGKPDMKHVSTSYIERSNLTMQMHKTLRMSPAMAARVFETLWDMRDMMKLVEDAEAAEPKKARSLQESDFKLTHYPFTPFQ